MVAPNPNRTPGSQRSEDPDREKTVTEKQLRANRRNAKRSTGPRSDQGKRRVARNAITHGVFARELLLPDENREQFLELRDGLIDSVKPQNALELTLVDQMFAAQWKVLRAQRAERALHELQREALRERAKAWLREQIAKFDIVSNAAFERFEAEANTDEKKFFVAAAYLCERELTANAADSHYGSDLTLAADIRERDNQALERLERYENRLHSQFHRSLRDLITLRDQSAKQGWADLPDSPYAGRTGATLAPAAAPAASSHSPGTPLSSPSPAAPGEGRSEGSSPSPATPAEGRGGNSPSPAARAEETRGENKPISPEAATTPAATEPCSDAARGDSPAGGAPTAPEYAQMPYRDQPSDDTGDV